MAVDLKKNYKNWVYGGLFLLFLGTIPLSIISLTSFEKINRRRIEVTERYARAVALSENLRYRKSYSHSLALLYFVTRDENFLAELNQENLAMHETINNLKKLDLSSESKATLDEITETLKKLDVQSQAGWKAADVEKFRIEYVRPLNQKSEALINEHFEHTLIKMRQVRIETDELTQQVRKTLVLTLIFTLIGYTLVFMLMRNLVRLKHLLDLQRDRQMKQVEDVSVARKEILESVSHDLKNPISTIQLVSQIMKRIVEKIPDQKDRMEKNLSSLEKATDKMKILVDDLLDAAKTESGNLALDVKNELPAELIEDAAESVSEIARSKDIKLTVDNKISTIPHQVLCDRKRVHQIFSNLIGNALKFTPPGGEIKIGFEDKPDSCTFFVKDSGQGIAQDQLPHLFDRYWQVEKKGRHGTGLGLSIVKGIIEKHGGNIEVQSTLGKGTIFSFQLPIT